MAASTAEAINQAAGVLHESRDIEIRSLYVEKKLQIHVRSRKRHKKRATFWSRLLQDRVIP